MNELDLIRRIKDDLDGLDEDVLRRAGEVGVGAGVQHEVRQARRAGGLDAGLHPRHGQVEREQLARGGICAGCF